ncbi:MAG TPA: NAD+ synthase [Candidatus Tidjanibacter gallistercoris]|nr:NAD+ synthase [Candidatus Tidjanibacter gallistercoris]
MRIAIAQLNYTIGDFERNKLKIIGAIDRARADRAELVVFAEQSISGTPAYDLLNKVNFLDRCEDVLIEIASCCDGIAALVGLPVQEAQGTVSAAAFIRNRKIEGYITRKHVLQRDDATFLRSGRGREFINIGSRRIAVVVGEDIMHPEEFSGCADALINIGSSQYARQRIEKRYEFFGGMAYRMGTNVVFVNHVGAATDVVYDGSSAVFNAEGKPLALLAGFEEDYRVVDLAGDAPVEIPYQNKTRNVYRAIKLGLGDFFRKNGYTRACLGLSGGIDSAVVAALAVEVLGAENVRVLLMPSQFSSDHSVEDAMQMVRTLGMQYDVVPITDIYRGVVGAMAPVFGEHTEFGVTEENIQARIRGVLLMALSNKFGHILLNTSNKSELALGWGTLYGDHTGMLSVIGDVYKSEVFDIARYINRDREIIPENILLKAPSAELRPEQKDTDYLPPYDITDSVIYRMIEEGQSREEIINAGFDAEVVRKIYAMILKNEQKRRQFCPTLRVSTCPFGVHRVMPITSKYGF